MIAYFVVLLAINFSAYAQYNEGTPEIGPVSCALVDCRSGLFCVERNGKAECVSQEEWEKEKERKDQGTPSIGPVSCALVDCRSGLFCVERNGKAECVSQDEWEKEKQGQFSPIYSFPTPPPDCNGVHCGEGEVCRMKEVRCVSGNCPSAVPECVAGNEQPHSTCESHTCGPNERCEMEEVRCFVPPCYPVPNCVANESEDALNDNENTSIPNQKCAANMTFTECTNPCLEPRCGMDLALISCVTMCFPPGCTCSSGYSRDGSSGCILTEDCPPNPECGLNEHLDRCPNSCSEPACGDEGRMWCADLLACDPPACRCDGEFVRNGTGGLCIQRSECVGEGNGPFCDANEVVKECSNSCQEPRCDDKVRLAKCTTQCYPPACECEEGFVRNPKTKQCIRREECPADSEFLPPDNRCSLNETHKECSNRCLEPFCGDEAIDRNCLKICMQPACECTEGFVRDKATGHCVLRGDCFSGEHEIPQPQPSSQEESDPAPSCDTHECAEGEKCELQEEIFQSNITVQCIRAPCHPIPTCVRVTGCATVRCSYSHYCEENADGEPKCVRVQSTDAYGI